VGEAKVFISHAWKYEFLDVVDALMYHFKDEADIIVWFDLFSNNQHKAVDLTFDWWCNTFKSAIQQFGRTVMVLAPWDDPIPLTRGWCLFELYCTADTGSDFEVAMSASHQQHFLDDMAKDGQQAMNKMLATINAEKSECWKPEDRDRIFDAVRKTVGFPGINAMVFEQLRTWVIVVTLAAVGREADITKLVGLKSTLGKLYEGQGKYTEAEPLYVECLAMRKQVLGDRHPSTLVSMNNLAALYDSQGKLAEAEPLYVECLAMHRQVLGDRHPSTLMTMNNLAILYKNQGRGDEAKALRKEEEEEEETAEEVAMAMALVLLLILYLAA
jgi:tetratricopeptide (TPR) repeat protein